MAPRNYKTINCPNHPKADCVGHVLEHVIVAEKKLGRRLKDGETVHHIVGNKKNNDPDNLMVFATSGDHTRFHKGYEAYQDGDVWKTKINIKYCEICGKAFSVTNTQIVRNRKYCSQKCRAFALRKDKDNDFTKEVQKQLFLNNGNFTQTAKMFDVCANALVKHLKKLNLPYHSKDYKMLS